MSHVLSVSRSGYYRWTDREKSPRQQKREGRVRQIIDTYATYKAPYSAPRIVKELLDQPCSVNFVANLLKLQGLTAHNDKAFNYGNHELTMHNVSENLLWRQ